MPRKKLVRVPGGTYHVMSRVNHRLEFPLPLSQCWPIFLELVSRITEKIDAEVHAFVLMANHYHMLLSTPSANIDIIMKYFNREATRAIGMKTGLENHIFGARYRWGLLYQSFDYAYVLKYIYRNPVKAGIVSKVEQYPYSTVRVIEDAGRFPEIRPSHLRNESKGRDAAQFLEWLNIPLPKEQHELILAAMRRKEFKFSQGFSARKIRCQMMNPPM